jgi:hypothetical protein
MPGMLAEGVGIDELLCVYIHTYINKMHIYAIILIIIMIIIITYAAAMCVPVRRIQAPLRLRDGVPLPPHLRRLHQGNLYIHTYTKINTDGWLLPLSVSLSARVVRRLHQGR